MKTVRSWALSILALAPFLVGFGGPEPFHVAPFIPSGGDFSPGAWVPSSSVSGDETVNLAVMATWCGHCERMLDQLSTNAEAADRVDMVLFFDSEYEDAMRRGGQPPEGIDPSRHLVYPNRLQRRGLPLYFAKKNEFGGLVSGYPTLLSCNSDGCRRLSRREIGLN